MGKKVIAGILYALAAVLAVLAIAGVIDFPIAINIAALTAVGATVLLVIGIVSGSTNQEIRHVRELASVGKRIEGRVVDALPYASRSGGAVYQDDGAQMVLQVEVPAEWGGTEKITVHVIEPSEAARARIGKTVTIVRHPDDPDLVALEGRLPNGRRAG